MGFIQRAFLYCWRQKLRSLILFLVLTAVATFVLTGVAIESSANEAAKNIRTSVGGQINLAVDMSEKNLVTRQSQWGYDKEYVGDPITDEILAAIREIPGVVGYNSVSSPGIFAAAVNFKYLPAVINMGPTKYGANSAMTKTMFSEKYSGFTSGKLKLVAGRHIVETDRNVIMISKELADYNNLSVGDKLQLYIDYTDKIVEREIVGIFSGTEGTGENALTVASRPGNQCIVDAKASEDSYGEEYSGYSSLDIYVEDPVDIRNVYNRIAEHPLIKGKTFILSIDSEEYETIANPLESLQSLVRTLIIIITVVSLAILALLLTIWIRGRVKETEILMSIGVRKENIIGQFVLECLIIALIAFGFSYPLSHMTADVAGNFIMRQVVDASNLQNFDSSELVEGDYSEYFDRLSGASSAELVKEIEIKIMPEYMIWVCGIGTLLILAAVLIASHTVIRLKPKEILSKMS
ncbi:hypothetical protein CDQ84_15360 [Clostridium thermosuccinogenes]|uniref:ABC3 transporter permease C-terminal domain-containing protein n=1 Tax=Clostridium thermosuccinogenes TaxID=84032 RepID=A0A2K2F9C0_9CLOT|nr:ABC transporter permease [Pseudoclostridium thermosuccinogenes]AUS96794.1 hypothetical protein CDO33_10290 [Pseudoclostridium thermosuccinogenes]PNT95347.1 hypothetical protein CDQ85_15220 [Pseudoclostridium thermosuccinogenes]PNT96360.1 hypothetical protein CDQ84_15360 [Pseudoclostridium thermosuccinogenes]